MNWKAELERIKANRRQKAGDVFRKWKEFQTTDWYEVIPEDKRQAKRQEYVREYKRIVDEYNEQVAAVLEAARAEVYKRFYNEPAGTAAEEMYKLRRFLEAEALKRNLVELWKQKPDVTFRENMFAEAERRLLYEEDVATARAYVEALAELFGGDPALKPRVNQFREALDEALNTRPHQMEARKMMEEIDQAAEEARLDVLKERVEVGWGNEVDAITIKRAERKQENAGQ